jgi:hypothetical protein
MHDKLTTLVEAAARVENGAQVGLRVVGVVHGAINIDFLVGAGAVATVDTASLTLGEFARTGPNFARYVQAGRARALDNT